MNLIVNREKFQKFAIATAEPIYFLLEFDKVRRNCTSNIEAYEKVERQVEELVGRRRYSDYEGFRAMRRRMKNR